MPERVTSGPDTPSPEAIRAQLEHVLALAPASTDALTGLAEAYWLAGEYDRALYEKARGAARLRNGHVRPPSLPPRHRCQFSVHRTTRESTSLMLLGSGLGLAARTLRKGRHQA